MAAVIPSDLSFFQNDPHHHFELETLCWLAESLPDDVILFHHVEWTDLDRARSHVGEIDFAVLSPNGRLVFVEQKNGQLLTEEGRLIKTYREQRKDVGLQVMRTQDHVKAIWAQQHTSHLLVESLIYLPDFKVEQATSINLPPENIVDVSKKSFLPEIILARLNSKPIPAYDAAQVKQFLCGEFSVTPDVGAAMEGAANWYRRQSRETFEFLQRLQIQPPEIHLRGCAGSGKTQLALQLFESSVQQGCKTLYTCFNRPLSDAMSALLPRGGCVANVDQLTHLVMENRAIYDFDVLHETLTRLRELARQRELPNEWLFDVLIVDEGQDFKEEHYLFLRYLMQPNARLYWLSDNRQQILDRTLFEPPLAAQLTLDVNYRSPRQIVHYINALLKVTPTERAGSLWQGEDPQFCTVTATTLIATLQQRVERLLADGYSLKEIVILTFAGLERHSLREQNQLGDWPLRRFNGRYTDDNQPIWTDGELLVETVSRFKGRQAKAVLFIDVDFDAWDERVQNKLYCGMTRATRYLELFLTQRAEAILLQRISSDGGNRQQT